MAVRKAVSAATTTFTAISITRFFIVPADTIHYSLFTIHSEGAVAHAAGGRDGRQEGCECGYYNLHRNLNETLLHRPCLYY